MENDEMGYSLNVANIADSVDVDPACRIVAMYIQSSGGMASPGTCLQKIPTSFLESVANYEDVPLPAQEKTMENVLLMSLLLNHAEGGSVTYEESGTLMSATFTLLIMEGLARKGLVEIEYRNVSLTDNLNEPLVRPTELGHEYSKRMGGKDE